MAYIIFSKLRNAPVMLVDSEEKPELGAGEIAIPCEASANVNDVKLWRKKAKDGLSLDESKAEKVKDIAAWRYEAEIAGIEIDGARIATDRQSQAMITGAALKASSRPDYSCRWKTAGGFVTLNASQIVAVADAVRDHVQACFDREADLLELVEAAETQDDLNSIAWVEPEAVPAEANN